MDSVHTVWLGKMKCQPKNVPYDCCFVSVFTVNREKTLSLAVKNIQANLIFDFIQVLLRSLCKNEFFHSLIRTFSLAYSYLCIL